MKIIRPLPNDTARCLGSNCDKKQDCLRHLTIEIDTKDYMWHMDAKRELKEQDCTLFIDFRGNYYEH